jgi:hypothetical protein
MQHGDILVSVSLDGEPQKLTTYWRGTLRDKLPLTASIAVLRPPQVLVKPWFEYRSRNIFFEPITRTENKRADLSISEKSTDMQAGEIAVARELTEACSFWLFGRRPMPTINKPLPNARLYLTCDGGDELVQIVESFGDAEVLQVATLGPVYTQGEPRKPEARWLPKLTGIDKSLTLGELPAFERYLAEGQAGRVRALTDRFAAVFRKKLAARVARVNTRITEVYGYGAGLEDVDHRVSEIDLEGYRYEEVLARLDAVERSGRNGKPKDKIRSWRAS